MSGDRISMELPARAEYGRVARAAAANLALRRGYTLTEIDDLRLAMDEAVIALLGPAAQDTAMSVAFDAEPARVTVELTVIDGVDIPAARAARFAEIAGGLVDFYEIDRERPKILLVKARDDHEDDRD